MRESSALSARRTSRLGTGSAPVCARVVASSCYRYRWLLLFLILFLLLLQQLLLMLLLMVWLWWWCCTATAVIDDAFGLAYDEST